MNISSLIKVFGIAAAGFVPQAQANPFGISFVKVDPPKDKKEEAICFRLKLSQTDVFSEHNFTDITFRPDTTVFLQKNMVIEDEEEVLKKTFKNFNAEKDPFEIPEKYLPLEDKDRAEWVDRDGKPLKFLVVAVFYKTFEDGYAHLAISGYPKQSAFFSAENVQFLDGVDCVVGRFFTPRDVERVGLHRKGEIQCTVGSYSRNYKLFRSAFVEYGGAVITAIHAQSESKFEGKVGSFSVSCPFFITGTRNISYAFPEGSSGSAREFVDLPEKFKGDIIAITRWDSSKVESCCDPEVRVGEGKVEKEKEGSVARIKRGETFPLNVRLYHNVSSEKDRVFVINKEENRCDTGKKMVDVDFFVFLFQEEQVQSNK